ncbi:MAG: helix-turn-helix domain-containing protein [Candidatus Bathyarchaeia archaeon]
MGSQFSEEQCLIELGLTLVEAKIYLALIHARPLSAAAIAKISKINRADVYRTIPRLQQLGLVEKIVRVPAEYRAIPVNEAISFLLQIKENQYKKVKATAQIFLKKIKATEPEEKQAEEVQLVLIPKGKHAIERIHEAIERATQGVDLVLSWRRFSFGIANAFAESVEAGWRKGVKFRFIIEVPPKNEATEQLVQYCLQKPFCRIRFMPYHPETVFGLYDKKEVFISIFPEANLLESPILWSKTQSLVKMAEATFEMLWSTAMESYEQDWKTTATSA